MVTMTEPHHTVTEASPEQQEMPFAVVQGQPQFALPTDLYIPPDALDIFLEAFSGPLDLLLYLIKRQNLDVLDIPIADITQQYMQYIDMMKDLRFELAAEYLVMAAMLAEIKSRMLLPRPSAEDDEEEDPRAELIRRLQEYERFKQAAEDLRELPQLGTNIFPTLIDVPDKHIDRPPPAIDLKELLSALSQVLHRADMFSSHHIARESLSVRDRMSYILEMAKPGSFISFSELFDLSEGRQGVIVTFMAILELLKQSLIEMVQAEPFATIHIKTRTS